MYVNLLKNKVMFRIIIFIAAAACLAIQCQAKIPVGVKSTISNAYGYIDENGEWAPGPMFRHARAFVDSLGAVTFDGNHYCLIDEFKQLVSDFVFPGVPYDGFNGLYSVKNSDGIVTLYNLNGEKPLNREFKSLKFDKGLIYGVEKGADKYRFYDGAGQPLGPDEYDSIEEYTVAVYPGGNRHGTCLFVGKNGKGVELLDANGEVILRGFYDIKFAQEYYHIINKSISKYNSKRKSSPEIDPSILDGIIIARPDGGKNYGVYLLTGRQLMEPKFKSAEKAAQEIEKKLEKVLVPLIKNGEYERDMEQIVQKIEKSRANRRASNLAALNATKPVYASRMEVVFPMVFPEETTATPAKGKSKSRSRSKKNSKAARTYYFSGNKKIESQKFAEIRNEGLQYVVRPVGSKKFKLYNLYGLPLSDEEYDEIVGWGYNKDGDHLFKVRLGRLWGVVSPLGVELLTPQFEKLSLPDRKRMLSPASATACTMPSMDRQPL